MPMMLRSKIINITFFFLFLVLTLNLTHSTQKTNLIENKKYLRSYLLYLKGNSFLKELKADQAILYYKKAIKEYNSYPEPYSKLAKVFFDQNDLNAVEKYLRSAGKSESLFRNIEDQAEYYRTGAQFYEKRKEYGNSLKYYQKLLPLDSNDPFINFRIGYLYYLLKDLDSSYTYLDQFVKDKSVNERRNKEEIQKAYKIIVNILSDKKKYDDALNYLKELYRKYPEKQVLERITILSNNLKYYDKKDH